jgi:hypothetical protein
MNLARLLVAFNARSSVSLPTLSQKLSGQSRPGNRNSCLHVYWLFAQQNFSHIFGLAVGMTLPDQETFISIAYPPYRYVTTSGTVEGGAVVLTTLNPTTTTTKTQVNTMSFYTALWM